MKGLLICFLICFPVWLYSQQSLRSTDSQAQKNYEQASRYLSVRDYTKAIEELKKAVQRDRKFASAFQQLGDISRRLRKYEDAAGYYRQVITINPDFHSLTYYGLAESELAQGQYDAALEHFNRFLSFPQISDASKKLALKYIADCRFSIEAIKNPVSFKPVNLGAGVNTSNEEYLPVVTADEGKVIFTRRVNSNEDFYESVKTGGSWQKATYLSSNINTSRYNEGAQCISPDGLYLFFTGCNRPDGIGRCDIYVCKREGNGWSEPFNIGPPVNTAGWESQPALTADGSTLYFVSNRKGGFGGYDIWSAELLEDGKWSEPVNLGPTINTPYDENSPFIHPDNNTLYFSSNGWPGLGNRDLFVSRKGPDGKWQVPQNLGYPINTAGEESGLTVSADGRTAFFASNMKGGYGGMDLYSFSLPEKIRPQPVTYVKGTVIDADTKEPLYAQVKLVDLKTSRVVFDEESEKGSGAFLATMPEGRTFGLAVYKDGYLFYTENFAPGNNPDKKPFSLTVPLKKIKAGGVVVLKNIFFETAKATLKPESKTDLQLLLAFLNANPTASIEISGHTDDVGTLDANQKLSESRAKSVYNYLIENKINPSRLSYKGYGETQPVADNSTEGGKSLNRRTEFRIVKY